MQNSIEHKLSLYTASDEMTETEPDFEDTQPMYVPPCKDQVDVMAPTSRSPIMLGWTAYKSVQSAWRKSV